jgi:hypothetical protein
MIQIFISRIINFRISLEEYLVMRHLYLTNVYNFLAKP